MNKNTQPQDRPKQKEIALYEFEISQFSKIVFSVTDWKGKRYINIRTWGRVHPQQQEWGRTQKGLFVEISKIKEIQEGIKQIAEYLDMGQLKTGDSNGRKKT